MFKELQEKISQIFSEYPNVLYGFMSVEFGGFKYRYKSALVFAVPYVYQLSIKTYSEKTFNDGILGAMQVIDVIVPQIEEILLQAKVKYYIPEVAQKDDGRFRAEFSFKDAAAAAGIGWFGKNDVIITERYGPRVRLSAILIDEEFEYGKAYRESLCPKECRRCVNICPGHALKNELWQVGMVRDDLVEIAKCNRIRSSFAHKLGRWGACALCLAVCPYGFTGDDGEAGLSSEKANS